MKPARAAVLALALACVLPAGCGDSQGESGDEGFDPFAVQGPGGRDLAQDDRVAWLLGPCANPAPFLEDTGDPIAILVRRLAHSQLDPMRQAKTELSMLGEAALPELRRFFEAQVSDPEGAPRLLNVLTVVGAMRTHAGRDLLLAALVHPQDTVRIEAIRGLAIHAEPEDYDRILSLVPISPPSTLSEIGAALSRADRGRAEDDFVAWLAGPRQHPAMWIGAPARFADSERPEILQKFGELHDGLEGESRYFLQAALARNGDESALAELRAALVDEGRETRAAAVRAFERVGMIREIAPRLWGDRDETLRGMVARAIGEAPRTSETDAWLKKGGLDRARTVQIACLRFLAERGDPEAIDQGMTLLEGDRADLEYGIQILRGAWQNDAEAARRAYGLLERLRSGEIGPVRVEVTTLDRAIAQLPLVEAARSLYDRGRTTLVDVDGLPAHRWYLMQAGNTGSAGRAWLRDRWAEEPDPAWRVDIAAATAFEKDEASRRFLLGVVDDERTTPLEVLHAANLLAHHGPTSEIAPRLKRVALRVADPRVRPALNCLLNQWYGRGE